jgi:exopolysaccharide biosynthesis polyprenyl glycosylphosphotransferase
LDSNRDARQPLRWLLEGRGLEILQGAVDFVAAGMATVIALGGVRATMDVSSTNASLLALPPLVTLLLYTRGQYRVPLRTLALDGLVPGVSAVSVAAMSAALLGLFVNGRGPSELQWLSAWLLALLAVGVGRTALSMSQRLARRHGLTGRPVLILGAGVVGTQLARRLLSRPEYGLRPVGLIDDDPPASRDPGGCQITVVGALADIDEIVRRTGAKSLIVAFSSVADARVSKLIEHCQGLGVEVAVVPRMFDAINHRVVYESIGGLPLLSFSRVDPKGFQFAIKHISDRIVAFALLVTLAPLLAAIALAVRLSSPGPVLFSQRRVGRDGQVFNLYKFRSMLVPASRAEARLGDETRRGVAAPPANGGDVAPGGVEGPDRRTRVGRLIRRLGMDELPQLINVVRGEMSLIGPRPERPEFVELFERRLERYEDRLRVKAGITGWAQVNGLRGNTSLGERIEWDNYYIANWSLGLDLKILLLTVVALFRGRQSV